MLGWFRLAAACASRRNRSTNVGSVGELGEEHLDRDRAVEQLVAGEEHLGHAAPGQASVQLVTPAEDGGALVGHDGRSVVGGPGSPGAQGRLEDLTGYRCRVPPPVCCP